MFELDQTSIVPLYKQLKDKIKDAILDGSLKPNQKPFGTGAEPDLSNQPDYCAQCHLRAGRRRAFGEKAGKRDVCLYAEN